MQKPKDGSSKEKAAEYYLKIKEVINEKLKNQCKNLSQDKKIRLKSIKEKDISN